MATDVNGRGAAAGRAGAERSVGAPGAGWERARALTWARARGERVRVMQICVRTLSLTCGPLSCHLWPVQGQPPKHVMPERHSTPYGVDKLRDGAGGGSMLNLLLQT